MFVPTNSIMDTIIQPVIRPAKRSSYRRHPVEFKRAVVEQSLTTGASVSRIAREHNVNANQVFGWRKLFKEGLLDTGSGDDCKLLPVALAELPCSPMPMRSSDAPMVPAGVIQLELGKARLRIEGGVDAATLALVLEHLLR